MNRARMLVVEDNELSRRLVCTVLKHRGHQVEEARTVAEALAALQREVPDLVLLDVQIPGGGGERLVREMRSEPRYAHVPIIAVTAFAMAGDRERFLASGFDGYMSKPIDTRTFGPEVESFLPTR